MSLGGNIPRIRQAGAIGRAFLWVFNFAGVVSPWRTIYVHPEYMDCNWLIRHEVAHLAQMDRDGWALFWWRCLFGYLWWGYQHSPYEVEARQAEFDPFHPLLDGWDISRAY